MPHWACLTAAATGGFVFATDEGEHLPKSKEMFRPASALRLAPQPRHSILP